MMEILCLVYSRKKSAILRNPGNEMLSLKLAIRDSEDFQVLTLCLLSCLILFDLHVSCVNSLLHKKEKPANSILLEILIYAFFF